MALFRVKYLRFMSLTCDTRPQGRHEIVISESLSTKEAHEALFCFDDEAYQIAGEGLFSALRQSASEGALKIHISGGWEWMLCLALWKEGRPAREEVFSLLKTLGLSDDDLRPFTSPDCNDIFHYLYYGQRFDVLRRLCTKARKVSETKIIHTGSIRINCHLVAEETGQIVASSL